MSGAAMINNGERVHLTIHDVFDGVAGKQGRELCFLPNRRGRNPATAKGGLIDGKPARLRLRKDNEGPLWLATIVEYFDMGHSDAESEA